MSVRVRILPPIMQTLRRFIMNSTTREQRLASPASPIPRSNVSNPEPTEATGLINNISSILSNSNNPVVDASTIAALTQNDCERIMQFTNQLLAERMGNVGYLE